jgi:hypothetical protein
VLSVQFGWQLPKAFIFFITTLSPIVLEKLSTLTVSCVPIFPDSWMTIPDHSLASIESTP